MKLDGSKHPADVIREEIDKMRAEITPEAEETINAQPPEVDDGEFSESDIGNQTAPDFEDSDSNEVQVEVPREQTVDYWKHRFEVIQGKYHAETADLRGQVNSLKEYADSLSQLQTSAFQASNVEQALDNLTEEYGEEFSKALDKRIQTAMNTELQKMNLKINQEISTVKQTQAQNEEQMFQDSIAKFVPNWVSINTDPTFISWLENNTETFSGFSLMAILRNAYETRDLDKVTKIFHTFTEKTKKQQPQVSQEQASLISPPKRGSVTSTTLENNSGKVYTQAEIQEFYQKLNAGDFKGKDEYVRQTKLAILQANAEGRII